MSGEKAKQHDDDDDIINHTCVFVMFCAVVMSWQHAREKKSKFSYEYVEKKVPNKKVNKYKFEYIWLIFYYNLFAQTNTGKGQSI